MPTDPENTTARQAAKARVRAKADATKAMPAREYIYNLLSATRTHAEAEAMLAEVESNAPGLKSYEALSPQSCPKGVHADWMVDSEHAHQCPWCRIAELEAGITWRDNERQRWSGVHSLVERAIDKGYRSIDTYLLEDELGAELAPQDDTEDPNHAMPSRMLATPAEIDQYLRSFLSEGVYLRYQQAIGDRAVQEAADDQSGANPDRTPDFTEGVEWAVDHVRPENFGGPYPSRLLCSQHGGFGPCPGVPRCTPEGSHR